MKMQVAYYYRTNHRDYGYDIYIEPGREAFYKRYGKRTVEEYYFWDEASGVDGNRKAFRQLISEIRAGHIRVVVTRDAVMIARDWRPFFELWKPAIMQEFWWCISMGMHGNSMNV